MVNRQDMRQRFYPISGDDFQSVTELYTLFCDALEAQKISVARAFRNWNSDGDALTGYQATGTGYIQTENGTPLVQFDITLNRTRIPDDECFTDYRFAHAQVRSCTTEDILPARTLEMAVIVACNMASIRRETEILEKL